MIGNCLIQLTIVNHGDCRSNVKIGVFYLLFNLIKITFLQT